MSHGLLDPSRLLRCQKSKTRQADLSERSSSGSLPSELVGNAARRLLIALYVVAGVQAMYALLYATVWQDRAFAVGQVTGVAQLVLALGLAYFLRSAQHSPAVVAAVGVGYEVALCFGLSIIEFWLGDTVGAGSDRLSWASVVIVFFPLLLAASPRVTLIGSVLSAVANSAAFALAATLRDVPIADPGGIAVLLLPPYVCAAIAYVPARVLYQLGTTVKQARRLGSYELGERLGSGGMGEVWRAQHSMLARPAAIKLIRPEMLGSKDASTARRVRDRFEREAQATAALESPHTVELFDFGVSDDGVFYYVMELLHGIDLETMVKQFGPLPAERVVFLLEQVCDSLDDAHHRALIHRDIKPANIYAARKGRRLDFVKVLDFGLVKRADAAPHDTLATADGEVTGTPAYMAPEMVTGETRIDARADIYALGCVAYWLLTGKRVFEEPTPMKVAIAHATQPPVPVSERTELPVPPGLEALIMQCLEKDRDKRPASALDLARALAAIELPQPWTHERAAKWWRVHLPELAAQAPRTAPPSSGTGRPPLRAEAARAGQ